MYITQGRQKQIKVGWDNFKFRFNEEKKSDKIQILPRNTICITKGKQNFHLGAKGELTMASNCNIL